MNRRANHPGGFTLVELMAATALASVLMLAVLALIGSVGRPANAAPQRAEEEVARDRLAELLRRDLAAADTFDGRPGRLELTGHGALDPRDLAPLQRPARVTYQLRKTGPTTWLVRRQVALDDEAAQPWSELVCPDVTSFEVRRLDRKAGQPGGDPAGVAAPLAGVPIHVQLVVQPAGPKRTPWEREVWVR